MFLRAVTAVEATGPNPGWMLLRLDCGHFLRFPVPARVPPDLAGWCADLLIGSVRSCGACTMDKQAAEYELDLADPTVVEIVEADTGRTTKIPLPKP